MVFSICTILLNAWTHKVHFFFNTKAVSHFDVPLEQVIPSHHLLRSICEDLLHIQVNIKKFSLSGFFDQSFKAKALFLEMPLLICF